jgi:hypothetical protein
MIRKEPISERFAARERAFARPNGGFAMPGLRLDRVIALTSLVLLLLTPRAALAEPTGAIDTDKAVPNLETVGPPANASERAAEGMATPPTPNAGQPTAASSPTIAATQPPTPPNTLPAPLPQSWRLTCRASPRR